jgi:malonate transporter and related proteins
MGTVTINIVWPLFGIMVAGYLAGRFRLLNEGSSANLGRFVFAIAMPALIFISLTQVPIGEFFDWPFLGALGGGMLIIFGLSMLVARFAFPDSLTSLGIHSLSAMYSSTAYVGLPLILFIFGDAALAPGIIGAVITGALFMPIGIILAEVDKGRGRRSIIITPLLGVIRNPVLIATVAGLTVSTFGIALPQPIIAFCEILGGAFIPCALFSAGLFMVDCSVKGDVTEIGWLVFTKLILHPLVTWWLAYHVFELEGILPAIAVLQAALPSGVPVFILAQHYNTFIARSSAVIAVSTALSVFTLSGLLILLEL